MMSIGAEAARVKTGIGELDRVLGGGLVKGSLFCWSGETRNRKVDFNFTAL